MKRKLEFDELEIIHEIHDVVYRSDVNEKTKAKNFQNNEFESFNFAVERQVEKFL